MDLYEIMERFPTHESCVNYLESVRFDDGAVQVLRPAVESVRDLHRLDELFHEALRAESSEALARVLSMNGDEKK